MPEEIITATKNSFKQKNAIPFSLQRSQRSGGTEDFLEKDPGRAAGQSKQGGWETWKGFCPPGELAKRSNQSRINRINDAV